MRRHVRTLTAVGMAVGLALGITLSYMTPTEAARNASGTYSLPLSQVTSGSTIQASWANTTLADLANEMTASLDRNGKGGMLAPLKCADGSSSLPAYTWTSDPDTGLYLSGTNAFSATAGGSAVQTWALLSVTALRPFVVTHNQTNSAGVTATGNGTARGGNFTGGGTNADGVGGMATGSGAGVAGFGGTTGPGGYFEAGTAATATTASDAVTLANGYINLSAVADPNSDVAIANRLTPANIVKVTAALTTDGVGGVVVDNGFNVASVAFAAGRIRLTFGAAFADAAYVCTYSNNTLGEIMSTFMKSTTYVDIQAAISATGAEITYDGVQRKVDIICVGTQ